MREKAVKTGYIVKRISDAKEEIAMLEDKELFELSKKQIITNAREGAIQPVSIDLHIDSVYKWEIDEKQIKNIKEQMEKKIQDEDIIIITQTPYQLKPQETVFVKTTEALNMPGNLVARILEKNSVMRLGLQISGPLYQPEHHTAIFIRVTNVSEHNIELQHDFSIAQIVFEKIATPRISYSEKANAQFVNDFWFKIPIHLIKKSIKPEEQFNEQIKTVESRVLSVFTMFMGAFVCSLALIVVNFQGDSIKATVPQIIGRNIALAICIVAILGTVFLFYHYLNTPKNESTGGKVGKIIRRICARIKFQLSKRNFHISHSHRKSSRIYLAARYCESERNQKLYQRLKEDGFDVLLPENLGLKESDDIREQREVYHMCCYHILKSGIFLAVEPFGKSVSFEVAVAALSDKTLIRLLPHGVAIKSEGMIDPAFHYTVRTEEELLKLLHSLCSG